MRPIPNAPSHRERGFSLVEIMVGMVIGLIGIIVMMQVFSISEERKRTTTSGADAMSGGAIALYQLQRDLREAGFGFTTQSLLQLNAGNVPQVTLPSGATIPLAPAIINSPLVPAGDPNTDTLLMIIGNTNGQPEGHLVQAQSGNVFTVSMPTSFSVNDFVIAAPGTYSAALPLRQVTVVTADSTNNLTLSGTGSASALFNLGSNPRFIAYAIRNQTLTSCDFRVNNCALNPGELGITPGEAAARTAFWVPVASNIASLRAQYVRAVATGTPTYDKTTPSAACGATGWIATSALRVALTARSSQYETHIDNATGQRVCDPVSSAAGLAAAAPDWPTTGTAAIDLTSVSDWQCYRYKVFQTIIPLRNIAWMTSC